MFYAVCYSAGEVIDGTGCILDGLVHSDGNSGGYPILSRVWIKGSVQNFPLRVQTSILLGHGPLRKTAWCRVRRPEFCSQIQNGSPAGVQMGKWAATVSLCGTSQGIVRIL